MKKLFTLLLLIVITISLSSQVPEKMSYQAVVRDAGNSLVINQSVGMKISVLQGSAAGTAVYVETQTPTTNENGLVTIEIGDGTAVTGTFAGIDWSTGPYYLKTETDPAGGTNYTIVGTSQLLSVPYAFYAISSKKADELELKLQLLSNSVIAGGVVWDKDGNSYNTVIIGTQTWMAENLKTTKYNDNTSIPYLTDNTTWNGLSTAAFCYYDNDINNSIPYGAMYNWFAIETGKLCPVGWHVPSESEFLTLETYLGGSSIAGGKLKEIGTTNWQTPNTGATNESGFFGLPGGTRGDYGTFYYLGTNGTWWTSTNVDAANSRSFNLFYNSGSSSIINHQTNIGFSVRCIKD